MRCIKCNYDNLDGMKYCVSCGAELITRDEKMRRTAEGEKSLASLRKVIVILLIVLVIVFATFVIVKLFFSGTKVEEGDNDTPTVYSEVNQDTVGVWSCDTEKFTDDNTISLILQSDGVFKYGPINGLKRDRIEGTFNSKELSAKDETGQYDLYSLEMNSKLEVEDGAEKEIDQMLVFTLAIDSQTGSRGIFSSGNAGMSSFYCSR